MTKFLLLRFFKLLVTIGFIVSLVFFLTRLSGDPTDWLLPDDASEDSRNSLRESLGLNEPLPVQYKTFAVNLLNGDMGKSFFFLRPVTTIFGERAGATIKLGFLAFGLAILAGVPLGVFAAVKRNSFFDRLTMFISIGGYTIPNFVLGILLIFLFSLVLRILPSSGFGRPEHFIMPVLALAVNPTASIARLTRSSMLDVLRQDYLDCARVKGVSEIVVIFKHALRNALIPVVTILGLQLGLLIGGSVVVETVFAWPGIGSLIVTSAQKRDFPMLQFGVMIIAAMVTLTNMLVDISYALLDPRIREK